MDEETIFAAALEKNSPAERAAFLDRACAGNLDLRRQVDELLRAYDDAGSYLQTPALYSQATEAMSGAVPQSGSGDEIAGPALVGSFSGTAGTDHEMSLQFLEPLDKSQPPDSTDAGTPLGRLGPYCVTEVIGRGGMGVVLKGQDPKLNRVVAIKVLAPELATNASARKRFLREAQSAAAVSHDHVVTIHAIDEAGRLPYIVMEYVAGCSLQERIERSGPLDVKKILRIARQTALGLAAAHEQGLIHRDIKPANILLENGVERVKLTDFGLARAVDDVGTTRTGMVAGTPQYMSPEQAQGQQVDHRSDLFSLGCVMYAMCTGRSPFRGESTVAVLRRVCDDAPRPVPQINPEIPEWLVSIIDKLLAKDFQERFQSAAEVAELLGKCLAHVQQPAQVPLPKAALANGADATVDYAPASRPASGVAPVSRRGRRLIAAAATVALFLVALGVTEATGVTDVGRFLATVLHIRTTHGTLVVEVDDPNVSVTIDGEDMVISGAGPQEVRLKPGSYSLTASKDGLPVNQRLVTITREGKKVVRIGLDGSDVPGARRDDLRVRPAVVFADFTATVASVAFSPKDGLLVAGDDHGILTRLLAENPPVREGRPADIGRTDAHNGALWVLAYSRTGRLLGSAAMDGTVCLWRLDKQRMGKIRCFSAHEAKIWALDFSPDESLFATAGDDQTVRIWDVETGKQVHEISVDGGVKGVCFSPDGRLLAAGDTRGFIGVWDTSSWERRTRQKAHEAHTRVVFSPDGSLLASVGIDKLVKLWRVDDLDAPPVVLHGHKEMVEKAAFSPDGRVLATVGGDWRVPDRPDRIHIWDVHNGRELVTFGGHSSVVHDVDFSPDGQLLATCSRDQTVMLWDIYDVIQEASAVDQPPPRMSEFRRFGDVHTRPVADVAYLHSNECLIATASYDGTVRIWDVQTGKEARPFLDLGDVNPKSVAASPDGRTIAVGDHAGMVYLWDVANGQLRSTLALGKGHVYDLAFSPDASRLYVSMAHYPERGSGALVVYDAASGEQLGEFEGIVNYGQIVAPLADGVRVLTGGYVRQGGVWDSETGRLLTHFRDLPQTPYALAASPDGALAAIGFSVNKRRDNRWNDPDAPGIWLCNVETGRLVRRLRGHTGNVNDLAFSADGRFLVSGSGGHPAGQQFVPASDNTLRVWDVETGAEISCADIETERGVWSLVLLPDGRHVVTAGGDKDQPDLRIWPLPKSVWPKQETDANKGNEVRRFIGVSR